ncbi:MAG: ABC transporter ATP-binding protein [Bacteroidaceae bacterium]|nr:ABC transporter ATP-binding protein [Bacteroidaceae bacterium]
MKPSVPENYTYKIENLSTGYNAGAGRGHDVAGQKVLLRNMDTRLARGVLTCLIGVNGAGKSTLLRTLAGIQPAINGQIELNGRAIQDYDVKELARLVSVVLTDEIPEQTLTAYELVGMGRMPYTGYWGSLSKKDVHLVEEALEMVGMSDFRQRRLHSLSDGERQKLMIAKALAQDTDVILLDEPVAFLDFPSKVWVLRLLSKVAHEHGKSVLLSIHDIELALQIADRLWLLENQNLCEGEPAVLASEGKIDFLFKGDGIEFDRETMQYRLTPNS